MATLKKFRPITPSQREMVVVTGDVTKGVAPEKKLLAKLKKTAKSKKAYVQLQDGQKIEFFKGI